MDAFYASIEQRDHPEWKGKPLAVGHAEQRGVVAAASYEARKFGVRSAMASRRALKLCPQLIFVPGRMEVYKEVSAEIHEIFHQYTDLIEPISLDEAFLDVTDNKKNIPLAVDIAKAIKQEIRERCQLVASAGNISALSFSPNSDISPILTATGVLESVMVAPSSTARSATFHAILFEFKAPKMTPRFPLSKL